MRRYRAPLAALVVAVLLGAAFWFLLYDPKRTEHAEVAEEIEQLIVRQQQLRNQISRLEEVRDNELAIRADLARLEEFIPAGTAQPAALRQLQLTADAAGVAIAGVEYSDPVLIEDAPETGEPGTVLARIPMTVRMEGGYFQAVDFFRRVEAAMPRAVLVQSVAMTEGTLGFPSLLTTWTGDMFTIVPLAEAEPEADEEAGEGDEDDQAEEGSDGDAPASPGDEPAVTASGANPGGTR